MFRDADEPECSGKDRHVVRLHSPTQGENLVLMIAFILTEGKASRRQYDGLTPSYHSA